jgi:hypothetical protein
MFFYYKRWLRSLINENVSISGKWDEILTTAVNNVVQWSISRWMCSLQIILINLINERRMARVSKILWRMQDSHIEQSNIDKSDLLKCTK